MFRKSEMMSDFEASPEKNTKRKLVLGTTEIFQPAAPSIPFETAAGELLLPVDATLSVRAGTGVPETLFNPICIGFFKATQNVKPTFPPELKLELRNPDKPRASKDEEDLHILVEQCAMNGSVQYV